MMERQPPEGGCNGRRRREALGVTLMELVASRPPDLSARLGPHPGTAAAEVTVRWHGAVTGDVLEKETHTIDAGTIWLFVSGEPGGFGWVGISSDRPVVPWGTTPVSSGQGLLSC